MPILNWIGKEAVVNHDKEVPFRLLKKVKSLSYGDSSQNLIIHGDNLEALKALMPYYQGQIKCIYIDPPYNTGNESWIYNDKVNSPKIKKWLGKVVGSESEDLCRHDKWLCMMYPRLKLLKNLLSIEGFIFVSIDDNEVYNLRLLLNDIFGADNFLAILPTIMNLKGNQDQFGFAGTHEYTLVFANDKTKCKLGEFRINDEDLEIWEEDEISLYKKGAPLKATGSEASREDRPKMFYPILYNKSSKEITTINEEEYQKIYNSSKETFNDVYLNKLKKEYELRGYIFVLPKIGDRLGRWRWGWATNLKEKLSKEVIVVINDEVSFYKKQRPQLGDLPTKKPKSIFYKPEYSSGNGTAQVRELFGKKIFDNPKPLELIKDIIEIGTGKNDLVLDSFAGSGTTGHAVLDLNKEDGGNRKFILIELEDKVAKDITSERVKRAIEKYKYNSGFEYCELDKPLFNEDGQIEQECSFEQLATYIYFTETNTNIDKKEISGNFIGNYADTEYYLIFKEKGKNILNKEFIKKLQKDNKKKVIYADKCLIDDTTLEKYRIQFKQIPYEVKVY